MNKILKQRLIKHLTENAYFWPETQEISLNDTVHLKKGFMMYDENTDSVTVYTYNDVTQLIESLGIEPDDMFYIRVIDKLVVGESAMDPNTDANIIHVRIW